MSDTSKNKSRENQDEFQPLRDRLDAMGFEPVKLVDDDGKPLIKAFFSAGNGEPRKEVPIEIKNGIPTITLPAAREPEYAFDAKWKYGFRFIELQQKNGETVALINDADGPFTLTKQEVREKLAESDNGIAQGTSHASDAWHRALLDAKAAFRVEAAQQKPRGPQVRPH